MSDQENVASTETEQNVPESAEAPVEIQVPEAPEQEAPPTASEDPETVATQEARAEAVEGGGVDTPPATMPEGTGAAPVSSEIQGTGSENETSGEVSEVTPEQEPAAEVAAAE